uniref:Zinc-finger double domain protein n=1 Tax=Musca domestica TaxID=7370 RepID=A0A1I8M9U5_MUSDO
MDENKLQHFIKNLCRVCSAGITEAAKNISDHLNEKPDCPTIMELLTIIVPQSCNDEYPDELPKKVCMACVQQLQSIYEFMESYKEANKKLLKLLKDPDFYEEETIDNKVEYKLDTFLDEEVVDYNICMDKTTTLNIDYYRMEEKLMDVVWTDECEDTYKSCEVLTETDPIQNQSTQNPKSTMDITPKNIQDSPESDLDCKAMSPDRIQYENEKDKKHTAKSRRSRTTMERKDAKESSESTQDNKDKSNRRRKNKKQVNKKPIECEFCGRVFDKEYKYRTHLQIHSEEKSHLCPECGKGFKTNASLTVHMKRHKGEKNVQCPQCPRRFIDTSGLHGHMYVHKDNKAFVCDICGFAFHAAYLLKRHRFLHTGIKNHACVNCDQRFATIKALRRHLITHTGEKPFECHYCDRSFGQSQDCHNHMRIHVGKNIHLCELCPLRFPLVRELRVHFATHKNDDEETRTKNLEARKIEVINLKTNFGYKRD